MVGPPFPTFRKVRLIVSQRDHHKFVVVNAMEGEPAAHRDLTLGANPHLILDGADPGLIIGAKTSRSAFRVIIQRR